MKKIIAFSVLCLAACTTPQQQTTIAGLEVGLAAAENGASDYASLPVCGTAGATSVCSDPAIVAKIKSADTTAYNAIKAAETTAATGASVDLTAATSALTTFQGIVATLPKKGSL